MMIYTYRAIWAIALILLGSSALSEKTPELAVSSDSATIEVETRIGPREFIQLPTLRYNLEIRQNCPADLAPASLSVSVADTRRSITADKLAATDPLVLHLTIPGEQIAPVAIAGFCATNDENSPSVDTQSNKVLRIDDILSLQAALSCSSDTGSQIYYTSTTLDVELHCKSAEVAELSDAN